MKTLYEVLVAADDPNQQLGTLKPLSSRYYNDIKRSDWLRLLAFEKELFLSSARAEGVESYYRYMMLRFLTARGACWVEDGEVYGPSADVLSGINLDETVYLNKVDYEALPTLTKTLVEGLISPNLPVFDVGTMPNLVTMRDWGTKGDIVDIMKSISYTKDEVERYFAELENLFGFPYGDWYPRKWDDRQLKGIYNRWLAEYKKELGENVDEDVMARAKDKLADMRKSSGPLKNKPLGKPTPMWDIGDLASLLLDAGLGDIPILNEYAIERFSSKKQELVNLQANPNAAEINYLRLLHRLPTKTQTGWWYYDNKSVAEVEAELITLIKKNGVLT